MDKSVLHPKSWTVGLNKIDYCARHKGVQYGKDKKDIQRAYDDKTNKQF